MLVVAEFLAEIFASWRFYLAVVLVIGPAALIYAALQPHSATLGAVIAGAYAVLSAAGLERKWRMFTSP